MLLLKAEQSRSRWEHNVKPGAATGLFSHCHMTSRVSMRHDRDTLIAFSRNLDVHTYKQGYIWKMSRHREGHNSISVKWISCLKFQMSKLKMMEVTQLQVYDSKGSVSKREKKVFRRENTHTYLTSVCPLGTYKHFLPGFCELFKVGTNVLLKGCWIARGAFLSEPLSLPLPSWPVGRPLLCYVFSQDFLHQTTSGQERKAEASHFPWIWMKTGDEIKYNSKGDIGEEAKWVPKESRMWRLTYLWCIKVTDILP